MTDPEEKHYCSNYHAIDNTPLTFTHPFLNFSGKAVEVWEWISNSCSTLLCIWLLIHSGIKLIYLVKGAPDVVFSDNFILTQSPHWKLTSFIFLDYSKRFIPYFFQDWFLLLLLYKDFERWRYFVTTSLLGSLNLESTLISDSFCSEHSISLFSISWFKSFIFHDRSLKLAPLYESPLCKVCGKILLLK